MRSHFVERINIVNMNEILSNGNKIKNNKRKKLIYPIMYILMIIVVILIIVAILKNPIKSINHKNDDYKVIDIIANSSTSAFNSVNENVDEFIKLLKNNKINCESSINDFSNVTPNFIKENSEYKIFKSSDTGETYLMYSGDIFTLGNYRNGNGVISFALADLDNNGYSELYFSYTWKSLNYRTNFGYFDSYQNKIINFDEYLCNEKDAILIKDNEKLCIATATNSEFQYKTNFKYNVSKIVATIEYIDKIKIIEK